MAEPSSTLGRPIMKTSRCKQCGKSITYSGSRAKLYCTESCRSKFRYANKTPIQYNNYSQQKIRGASKKLRAIELLGGKCETCGQTHPAALCFHHKDPNTKRFTLDVRVFANNKWSVILPELNKCVLLCFNCHHILHYGENWLTLPESSRQTDHS